MVSDDRSRAAVWAANGEQAFRRLVDQTYATARGLLRRDGRAVEMLLLTDASGSASVVSNATGPPLPQQPAVVRALIDHERAVAAVHVTEVWYAEVHPAAGVVDLRAPSRRPDRREALVVAGLWPTRRLHLVHAGQIIRGPAGPEVHPITSPARVAFTPENQWAAWLATLLPEHAH